MALEYFDAGAVRLGDTGTRSVTSVAGLIGLPQIRGAPFDRPEQDGAVEPFNQFLSARPVTVAFEVWADSIAAAFEDFGVIAQALEAMIHAEGLLKWKVFGDTRDLQMGARLVGSVLPNLDADDQGPFLRGLAQFRCADPRAYSQMQQVNVTGAPTLVGGFPYPLPYPIPYGLGITGGSVVVENAGNTDSWPVIYLAGPASGPVITIGSDSLAFPTLVIGLGQTLTIVTNPTARAATVDGSNVLGALRFADSVFAPLAPGQTTVSFYTLGGATTTDTTLSVAWRDAWTA